MNKSITVKAIIEKFDSGMHFIHIPKAALKGFSVPTDKRLMARSKEVPFRCALQSKKEGGYYINLGKTLLKKLRAGLGDELAIELSPDASRLKAVMPEELRVVLESDPEAQRIFNSLADGRKRGLIYVAGAVKSTDKRIERALKIAEKLKMGVSNPREILK